MAHRFSYEEKHGPTDAETLDHLCRVHPCVNYDHLEPASTYENVVVRGTGITAINAKKEVHSTCGGPYSVIQSGKHKGMRYCKACAKERRKNERQRKGMGSCIAQR